MNETEPTQELINRLKEGGIPKIYLRFAFENDATYLLPIISNPENVESIGFIHIPTFDTADGHSKVVSEKWVIDVGYGEGLEP